MNFGELRDQFMDFLGESDVQGTIDPAEVDLLIHSAHLRVFVHIAAKNEGFFHVETFLSEVVGQSTYALGAQTYKVLGVSRAIDPGNVILPVRSPLTRISSLPEVALGAGIPTTGTPAYFYLRGQTKLTLLPTPQEALTNSISVDIVYTPARMLGSTDVPFQVNPGPLVDGGPDLSMWHDLIWKEAVKQVLLKEESGQWQAMMQDVESRYAELDEYFHSVNQHAARSIRQNYSLTESFFDDS
jgi:hypothetical protein